MRAAACLAALVLAAILPASAGAQAGASNEWLSLARQMTKPWPTLQRGDGSFYDYVVANDPTHTNRDPYGRSFMGLALLQSGLRDNDSDQIAAAMTALGEAAAHPAPRDRIVFENLALETAYNLARAQLSGDRRFQAVRSVLESRLKRITPIQFGGSRPYYNYYLVDAAGLMELLSTGLTSNVPGSALAQRARTKSLVAKLVNHTVPHVAGRFSTSDDAGRLAMLSDPPWNPPAYDAFSLALLARIVGRLGPAAGRAPREVMRSAARALWALAAPDGSISYYARSQDQSWTLAMTAYGAEAAAALPNTSATDHARFNALAERALVRLRDTYVGGRFGFWITPAFSSRDIRDAVPGLDRYADAASYSGLTLVGLNWALEQMPADGPPAGEIAADRPGAHRLARGPSALIVVRTPDLWFAVKQGPGVHVKGVGDYRSDVRYDSGLVALKSFASDGSSIDIIPSRPHSRTAVDRAEPVLLSGRTRTRFWGTGMRKLASGGVALTGGFRTGNRWLRRGVTVRYAPSACGLAVTLPTRRGDLLEQTLWFRGRPRASAGGTVLSDALQRVTLSAHPASLDSKGGYASGTETGLVRTRLHFRGTGRPITLTFCPAGGA